MRHEMKLLLAASLVILALPARGQPLPTDPSAPQPPPPTEPIGTPVPPGTTPPPMLPPPAYQPRKPLFVLDLAGGVTFATGALAPRLDPGWNFKIGAGANLSQAVTVEAEYLFTSLAASSRLLGGDLSGHQDVHALGVTGLFSVGKSVGLSGYVVGGPAVYYRRATISQYAGTGFAPYCDPFFGFCYATPVSFENVLGTHSEWDLGLNAGLGLAWGIIEGDPQFFLESRYHYLFGKSYQGPNGSVSSSAGYVPIILGIRY